jgi:hypothetical protein
MGHVDLRAGLREPIASGVLPKEPAPIVRPRRLPLRHGPIAKAMVTIEASIASLASKHES